MKCDLNGRKKHKNKNENEMAKNTSKPDGNVDGCERENKGRERERESERRMFIDKIKL